MNVAGILLDLEGVLYQEDTAILDAVVAVGRLADLGLALRCLTNTTTQPREAIAARLKDMGFGLDAKHVVSPTVAAAHLLRHENIRRVHLAAAQELAADLRDFQLVDDDPEAVILGDLHQDFTWDRLNGLFQMVQQGAWLIALHKNRYCRREREIALDLGPFVAALDYAGNVTADIVGKPSRAFFNLALDDLGLTAHETLMVGDDLEVDIGGAQAVGMHTIQVKTGKFRPKDLDHPSIQPDQRIESIAALPDVLDAVSHVVSNG
ncbi:MAG: TIGR01458 family HAD-type hydrolase [Geminicoccaceae bacterium]